MMKVLARIVHLIAAFVLHIPLDHQISYSLVTIATLAATRDHRLAGQVVLATATARQRLLIVNHNRMRASGLRYMLRQILLLGHAICGWTFLQPQMKGYYVLLLNC